MVEKKYSRKINVLLLVDQLWCSIAGTEQHISFLMHNLPSIGCKVHLSLLRDTGYYDSKCYPSTPHIINFQTFKSFSSLRNVVHRLKNIIQQHKIDIIYTFFPDSEIIACLAVRNSRRCLHIAARRNFGHGHNLISLWRTRFTNIFIPNFIANCNAVKKRMKDLEFIPLRKIEVISNPINDNRIERGLSKFISKNDLGIQNEAQIVGIVATLSPVKDHESFLLSAQIVLERFPQVQFVIAGRCEPDRRNKLDKIIKKLGVKKSVFFAGEHENPIPLMKLFDVGVLSSKSEGLSNTLLEYAAVGMPIVATEVGGNPEIVVHGENGYLVPPSSPELLAKSIMKLLANPEGRKKFAKSGQERVCKEYVPENILARYRLYFDRLLNNRL